MTERERFEAWYKSRYGYSRLYLNQEGNYHHPVDSAWEAWQAAQPEIPRWVREAAERLSRHQMFVKDCQHTWNAHQQCQWCRCMRRDVDIDLVATFIKEQT